MPPDTEDQHGLWGKAITELSGAKLSGLRQRNSGLVFHAPFPFCGIPSGVWEPAIFRQYKKKRPPFSAGAKLPWFSLLRELDWRPDGGGAVGTDRASGEWLRGLWGAPHPSWVLHPGGMRHPRPPNWFSSNRYAPRWALGGCF